ncbi:hypothetical protein HOY80DRAFT_738155 [Tuber brumale]|nr:hypothetical protein HOY80DRAFT_738155 [Tuber brumale]
MSHLKFGGCLADPSGGENRYSAVRQLETGIRAEGSKATYVRFMIRCASSTRRSQDLPKAAAAAHLEHSFDPADAGVEGSGGNELQEMRREMHLGATVAPGAHSRNLSTSTISPGEEIKQLDPNPVSDSGELKEARKKTKEIYPCACNKNYNSEAWVRDARPCLPSIPLFHRFRTSAFGNLYATTEAQRI